MALGTSCGPPSTSSRTSSPARPALGSSCTGRARQAFARCSVFAYYLTGRGMPAAVLGHTMDNVSWQQRRPRPTLGAGRKSSTVSITESAVSAIFAERMAASRRASSAFTSRVVTARRLRHADRPCHVLVVRSGRRLTGAGMTPEAADRWLDAWVLEATGGGLPQTGRYWNAGWDWIAEERAARRPGGSDS